MRKTFLTSLVILAACGGPQIDRLTGEPASVNALTEPQSARTHPAIDGIQRFLAAMQTGEAERAWLQLSMDTRKVLQARAAPAGLLGRDLLRLGRLPVGATLDGAVPFDPTALFAVRGIKTLQLSPTPEREDVIEQRVQVTGAQGTRTIVMRFEGHRWRIHLPELTIPQS